MIEMLRFLSSYLDEISRIKYVLECELYIKFGEYAFFLHATLFKRFSNYLKAKIEYV